MHGETGATLGEQLRRNETKNFSLLETRHEAGLQLPSHAHVHPTLTLLLEGAFVEDLDGHTLDCRPLDVIFKPGGLEHANAYSDSGARCFVVEITNGGLAELGFAREARERPWAGRGAISSQFFRLYRSGFGMVEERTLAVQEVVVDLANEVVGRSSWTSSAAAPGWLARVRDSIHENLSRPPTLPDLAAEAGVHPTHVCRVFRRHFGCSISSYVQRQRIDEAVGILVARPNKDLSTVALRVGYYDQSHFTRAFRRVTGDTPGSFRDALEAIAGGPKPS